MKKLTAEQLNQFIDSLDGSRVRVTKDRFLRYSEEDVSDFGSEQDIDIRDLDAPTRELLLMIRNLKGRASYDREKAEAFKVNLARTLYEAAFTEEVQSLSWTEKIRDKVASVRDVFSENVWKRALVSVTVTSLVLISVVFFHNMIRNEIIDDAGRIIADLSGVNMTAVTNEMELASAFEIVEMDDLELLLLKDSVMAEDYILDFLEFSYSLEDFDPESGKLELSEINLDVGLS